MLKSFIFFGYKIFKFFNLYIIFLHIEYYLIIFCKKFNKQYLYLNS